MENSFRPMRRKRQQLTDEQCEQILQRATYGVLCVLGDNDYPYGVPVNYVYHNGTYFRSVIIFGHVRFLEDEQEKRQACVWLGQHFNPGDDEGLKHEMDKGFSHLHMVEISIDHMTGKEAIELVRMRSKA